LFATWDALDGIRAVKERHPDVVLSEISLPMGAGFNFCEIFARSARKMAAAYR
jgi:DNA-binding NarL/FixJ family response regulator